MKKRNLAKELFQFENDYPERDLKLVQGSLLDYSVYDCSVGGKHFDEDRVYTSNNQYLPKVRRGNTFIQVEKKWRVLRRGLTKFFDIQRSQIKHNLQVVETARQEGSGFFKAFIDCSFSIKDQLKRNLNFATFSPLFRAVDEGHSIRLYKLLKANGENAQVSFNKTLKMWAISSKNVSLLAQSSKDLKHPNYDNQRFRFALEIAKVWFDFLHQLTPQQVQKVQLAADGRTFVAEYVGNQEHQHLVKYNHTHLLFYAIVQNDVQVKESCLEPSEAMAIFQEINVATVRFELVGQFKVLEQLLMSLDKVFEAVCKGSLKEQQEGSVIYFSSNGKTLSLGKLKTLQYRLLRKLREKVKHVGNKPAAKLKDQFVKEMQILMREVSVEELPRPPKFYVRLSEQVLEYVQFSKLKQIKNEVSESYIDFLSKIMVLNQRGKVPLTDEDMTDPQVLLAARQTHWDSFPSQLN